MDVEAGWFTLVRQTTEAMASLDLQDISCSNTRTYHEEKNKLKNTFHEKGPKSDIGTRKRETGYLDEGQEEAGNNTQSNNSPSSNLNLLVGDSLTHIPHQMAQTIERVVGEREASNQLGEDGKSSRPCSERSSKTGRLEVPAESRSNQV